MGLWDLTCKVASGAGKAIKYVLDKVEETNRESEKYLDEYRQLDKEELIAKYKSSWSSTAQKWAVKKVMKEKGYTKDTNDEDD